MRIYILAALLRLTTQCVPVVDCDLCWSNFDTLGKECSRNPQTVEGLVILESKMTKTQDL